MLSFVPDFNLVAPRDVTIHGQRLWMTNDVNGDDAHPVFDWLKSEKGGLLGSKIKWNFTKFLVGRDGNVIKRYGSTTKPEDITKDLEEALAA